MYTGSMTTYNNTVCLSENRVACCLGAIRPFSARVEDAVLMILIAFAYLTVSGN